MRAHRPKFIVSSLVMLALLTAGHEAPGREPSTCRCRQCSHFECYGVDRDPGFPSKPKHDRPGDVSRGDCPPKRYLMNDCERAGNPHVVAGWADCSINDKYSAWFVGGGAAFAKLSQLERAVLSRGRCRKANGLDQHGEGTWGLDYSGCFGKGNVWLMYTRGREQGSEGAYATDGEPKLLARLKSLVHHE